MPFISEPCLQNSIFHILSLCSRKGAALYLGLRMSVEHFRIESGKPRFRQASSSSYSSKVDICIISQHSFAVIPLPSEM